MTTSENTKRELNGLDDMNDAIRRYYEYQRDLVDVNQQISFSAWLTKEGYTDRSQVSECLRWFGFSDNVYPSKKLCYEDIDAVFGKDWGGVERYSLVYNGKCLLEFTCWNTRLRTFYTEPGM